MKPDKAKITENDVIELMDLFTRVPVILLKGAISSNMNAVKTFQNQIESYKTGLTSEEMEKIKVVLDMDTSEIQEILAGAYNKTGKEQFKILSDPKAGKFISTNLNELEKVLFD